MFRSYVRIFIRTMRMNPGYSLLHIAGLSIAIASFIFIALYISDELSYDRYHRNSARIYRLHQTFESEGLGEKAASVPFPVLEPILNDYKNEVESYCRFFNFQSPFLTLATIDGSKYFNESRVFFTDSTVFDVFDFKLENGAESSPLSASNTVVITQSMADKYFPGEDPVGKSLKLQQQFDLLITGVVADPLSNSHFTFDFLVSFPTIKHFFPSGNYPSNWSWNPVWTYLLFKDEASAVALQKNLPAFVEKYYPNAYQESVTLDLFPLTDIHLHATLDYEIGTNSSIKTVFILGSIAIAILLIASINFINLSTARAARRSLEVGIRKTFGSQRRQLVNQFLTESVVITFTSVILGVAIVCGLLSYFNELAEKNIAITFFLQSEWLAAWILFPVLLGIFAGIYPAFVLSAAKPVTVASRASTGFSRNNLRRGLVVFQFALSIMLLIGTGVIVDQLVLLREGESGFEKENVVLIPVMRTGLTNAAYETLKDEFLSDTKIVSVSAVEDIVGSKHQVYSYRFEGLSEVRPFPTLQVRHDFTNTFGVTVVAGRDYDETFLRDDSTGLVVNEMLVRAMGWKSNAEAIGKQFDQHPDHRIVGVVKDFNFTSRHHPVRPLVLDLVQHPASFSVFLKYVAVRIDAAERQAALQHLEKKWKTLRGGWPFEYFFLENNLQNLYRAEEKLSTVTMIFSGLSLFVGCLGLFGLATFSAHQRSREMSIRKVLGGTSGDIFSLFCNAFLKEILLAIVIGLPASWFAMDYWLATFFYRTDIAVKWMIAGPAAAVVIALMTISYHAFYLSNTNPAEVLRSN